MEFLTTSIVVLLLCGLFASPFLIHYWLNTRSIKYKFIAYLTLGVVLTAILTLALAWWAYKSDKILLTHYGYDFEAWNDFERFANVEEENLEEVKTLEIRIMGIAWPLKAMIAYAVYSPYSLIGYLLVYLIGKRKKKANTLN